MASKKKGDDPLIPPKRMTQRIVRSNIGAPNMAADPFAFSPRGSVTQGLMDFANEGGRRGAEIPGLGTGPSATSIINSAVARRRSRYAVLTNPYAKRAVDIWVSNVVGDGHKFVSMAPDKAFKKQVEDLHTKWRKECDTADSLSYSGVEALAFRSMVEGGDCFIRMRPRRMSDGLSVPLQLQVIESEQVPVTKNEMYGQQKIIGGIQYDILGAPIFYHMLKNHPGEFQLIGGTTDQLLTVPVPAGDVIHLHDARRPNQTRGLPFLSQVIIQLNDLDRYLDAELVRKKACALIGGFIGQPADGGEGNPFVTDENPDEVEIEALEPGAFPVLPPGYTVTFSAPADVGINFKEFLRQQLMFVAAGLNLTYEQLTGDLTNANERIIRATMLEFKRIVRQYQRHVLVHQLHSKIFDKWFDMAVLSGALVLPTGMTDEEARRVNWIPDPWDYFNPVQEVQSKRDEIRCGFRSRSSVIMERGDNPEDVDAEIAADKNREQTLGLVFDTDPNATSRTGVAQFNDPEAFLHDPNEVAQPAGSGNTGNQGSGNNGQANSK